MTSTARLWPVAASAKVLLAAAIAASLFARFNVAQFQNAYAHWPPGGETTLASRLSTWDVAHYLRLSEDGYTAGSYSCAFFPLWPAAIHLTSVLLGHRPMLAAMLLTTVLSFVGWWLFFRLVERRYGSDVRVDSLILMLAFPGALFFSFPYSESIYFVLVMLFFWGLDLERWAWVGAAGFLLPLARPTGIFVLLPLAWYFYERASLGRLRWKSLALDSRECLTHSSQSSLRNENQGNPYLGAQEPLAGVSTTLRRSAESGSAGASRHHWFVAPWLLALCPLLGYGAYFGVMYVSTGNAFEGFAAQRFYPNSPSIANIFNVTGFADAFLNAHTLGGMMDSAIDRLLFLLFLALLWPIYRLDRTWFFYVMPAGLVPALSSWFMSYRRYVVVLFPMFVVLALLLRKTKGRLAFWYYVAILAALQAWAVKQFVNFNWAG